MEKKNIVIGGDHAGFFYKKTIVAHLEKIGYEVKDMGPESTDSVDYPDYIHPLASWIKDGKAPFGIIICGSGNGVAMTANKYATIRAAICWNEDLAAIVRQHNDANILAIPARFVSEEMAIKMVDTFLKTEFEGGRHARRVNKIAIC